MAYQVWNYGVARRTLEIFKERVVSHKNRIDYCLRYHVRVLEAATRKRDIIVKELEDVKKENKTLDHDIAAMGLVYRFKMLQLKLKYQMEINDAMRGLQVDIIGLTITQRKTISKLQKLKELRKRIEVYLIHVHLLLKAISDHEASLQRKQEPATSA